MAAIAPFARLIRLTDDAVLAQTTNLLAGTGRESVLDAAGSCTVVVDIADVGTIPASGQGFAAALLSGAGGPGLPGTVVPLLLLAQPGRRRHLRQPSHRASATAGR
jgi:hypothetical protein